VCSSSDHNNTDTLQLQVQVLGYGHTQIEDAVLCLWMGRTGSYDYLSLAGTSSRN
jgi:hypothetical protein